MSSNTKQLNETFDSLQKVDVSDIMTSMALGVAKAQEKLDDNSVKQLLNMSKEILPGKTLLDLGFVPSFYTFDYVDISASIHLNITTKSSVNFGLEAKLNYAKQKGYTQDTLELLDKSREESSKKEFKSTRSLLVKANESKSIKVQSNSISINQTEGSVTKLENFSDKLKQQEKISRAEYELISKHSGSASSASTGVHLSNNQGYINIFVPGTSVKYGILKIADYGTVTAVTINGAQNNNTFNTGTDFNATLTNIQTANILTGLGNNAAIIALKAKSNVKKDILDIYYAHDKDEINPSYSEQAYNNTDVYKKLKAIELLLKANPSLSITIEGHTDSSGPYDFNEKLGKRRAEKVKKYFLQKNITNTINCISKSESDAIGGGKDKDLASNPLNNKKDPKYRKTTIVLDDNSADYIYFQGDSFAPTTATPDATAQVPNGYIKKENLTAPSSNDITFTYGQDSFTVNAFTSAADFITKFRTKQNNSKYDAEVINEVVYLLHEETEVKFTAYNAESEEITMENVSTNSSANAQNEDTWFVDDNRNKESEMRRYASNIEDPSTITGSASLDLRTSRQFDITADGNASFSARLKSLPPPEAFKTYLKSIVDDGQ